MKDYFHYGNKVCVVTGSASGMGYALTKFLVDAGAIVYAIDRNPTKVEGLEKEIICDLIYTEQIDQAFLNEIPYEIDCFFGVAGISGLHNTMMETFKVNYYANRYIIEKYLWSRMVYGGSITLCTSSAGLGWDKEDLQEEFLSIVTTKTLEETEKAMEELILPLEGRCMVPLFYGVSKKAINYYIATMVEKLAVHKRIRINAILPMGTDTGMRDDFAEFAGGLDEMIEYGTGNALRMAMPREMAEPMAFLGSHMASFCSGVMMSVDFGMRLPMTCGIEHDAFHNKGLMTFD